jgi:hypothetical protein
MYILALAQNSTKDESSRPRQFRRRWRRRLGEYDANSRIGHCQSSREVRIDRSATFYQILNVYSEANTKELSAEVRRSALNIFDYPNCPSRRYWICDRSSNRRCACAARRMACTFAAPTVGHVRLTIAPAVVLLGHDPRLVHRHMRGCVHSPLEACPGRNPQVRETRPYNE